MTGKMQSHRTKNTSEDCQALRSWIYAWWNMVVLAGKASQCIPANVIINELIDSYKTIHVVLMAIMWKYVNILSYFCKAKVQLEHVTWSADHPRAPSFVWPKQKPNMINQGYQKKQKTNLNPNKQIPTTTDLTEWLEIYSFLFTTLKISQRLRQHRTNCLSTGCWPLWENVTIPASRSGSKHLQ